jgi:hypothetical protein
MKLLSDDMSDADAIKHIKEVRDKLGDKPVPKLLCSMLQEDPNSRASMREVFESPIFEGHNPPAEQEIMFEVPEHPIVVDNPPDLKQLGDLQRAVRKHLDIIECTQIQTQRAALEYVRVTGADPLYCTIIAMKAYEVDQIDLEEIDEYSDDKEYIKFDLEHFIKKEAEILKQLSYCVYTVQKKVDDKKKGKKK